MDYFPEQTKGEIIDYLKTEWKCGEKRNKVLRKLESDINLHEKLAKRYIGCKFDELSEGDRLLFISWLASKEMPDPVGLGSASGLMYEMKKAIIKNEKERNGKVDERQLKYLEHNLAYYTAKNYVTAWELLQSDLVKKNRSRDNWCISWLRSDVVGRLIYNMSWGTLPATIRDYYVDRFYEGTNKWYKFSNAVYDKSIREAWLDITKRTKIIETLKENNIDIGDFCSDNLEELSKVERQAFSEVVVSLVHTEIAYEAITA